MANHLSRYLLLHIAQGLLIGAGGLAFLTGREQSVAAAVYFGAAVISQAIIATRRAD